MISVAEFRVRAAQGIRNFSLFLIRVSLVSLFLCRWLQWLVLVVLVVLVVVGGPWLVMAVAGGGGGGGGGGVGDVSNCWAICGLPDPCAKNPNLSSQHRDLSRLV